MNESEPDGLAFFIDQHTIMVQRLGQEYIAAKLWSTRMQVSDIGVATFFFGACFASLFIGRFLGKRLKQLRGLGDLSEHIDMMQGAMLGLLGLLLGFSFSGASSRFIDRQQLIVREANAISSAYQFIETFASPDREQLQSMMRAYASKRAELAAESNPAAWDSLNAELETMQDTIWSACVKAPSITPGSIAVVLKTFNDVSDLHAERKAASHMHLPVMVMTLLTGCALLTLLTVGYAGGLSERAPLVFSASLTFLIASAMWATYDLDHPKRGMIRVDSAPIVSAARAMHSTSSTTTGR